jgi:ribonuclease HI
MRWRAGGSASTELRCTEGRSKTNAIVYVDGSGSATGGVGGVGFVGKIDGRDIEGSLPLPSATNQQAELLAAAYALTQLPPCEHVAIYSDSQYVVNGWGWLDGWIERGWRTRKGAVANRRHWQRLIEASRAHGRVVFHWTRGHVGTEGNERADALAGEARYSLLAAS